ncbi:MAG: hypothetical protein GTO16_13570 [Candidatus Aminicenantes bacterium]|nr:hypothetical protein [Candidatus Aminicenantes bacterium]
MKRIISVSICLAFVLSASTILLPLPNMTFDQFQQRVRSLITARNGALNALFNAKNYQSMPDQLKFKTKIVTHEGEVISGEDSENYWRKIGSQGGINLNFEEPQLTFMELEVSEPPLDEEIDYVAIEITKFTFTIGTEEHEGYLDPIYRHRVRCTVED